MTDLRKAVEHHIKDLRRVAGLIELYPQFSATKTEVIKAADMLEAALAQPEQTVEPPDYVEPVTYDYHDGWEEGFKAGVGAKTKGTKMTLEEFRDYVVLNAMYETIYTDGEGKSILVITMSDAYALMNKIKEQA